MPPPFALSYRVCPAQPEAHLFSVDLEIPQPTGAELTLDLPAWIPGSYMIRDFARNLVAIEAEDAAGPVAIEKLDKQTWRLSLGGGPLKVRWRVYAWELSVRSAHLDTRHAYFNGAGLFLRVAGLADRPCRVELAPPPGDRCGDWRVATSLTPLEAEPYGFGTYRAEDYEDLIDHPVEMGRFDLLPFTVRGVPHALVLSGRHRADSDRLQRDLARVCEQHAALFGELPVDRYLFLTTLVGDGYGGLEHRFSTSLLASRDDLPTAGGEPPSEGYRRFLGLASHEYFHLWHVKRIRPRALAEADLRGETHTRLLWAFEGITSYYDDLALVRSGVIDERAYLELLAQGISRVLRTPGRLVQTVAESSFDAWTKLYKADENAPNAIVSYYAKGALVALALDLIIRRGTNGASSLDHVMRALWERHGRTGVGVEERGIEALADKVSGLDLADFFARALDSTEDIDLAPLLAELGIEARLRAARGPKDQGGIGNGEPAPACPQPTLGVRLQPTGSDPMLQNVLTGSAAEQAGLAPGDTLVAIDGLRVTRDNLDGLLARIPEGAEVSIHAFRRDELIEVRARPQPAPLDTCELVLIADAPPAAAERRAAWLGRTG